MLGRRHNHNDRTADNDGNFGKQVSTKRLGSDSARSENLERRFRDHRLLDSRRAFRHLLLGVLRLHAPAHEQRPVPDPVRPTAGLVMEARRGALYSGHHSHVTSLRVHAPT